MAQFFFFAIIKSTYFYTAAKSWELHRDDILNLCGMELFQGVVRCAVGYHNLAKTFAKRYWILFQDSSAFEK